MSAQESIASLLELSELLPQSRQKTRNMLTLRAQRAQRRRPGELQRDKERRSRLRVKNQNLGRALEDGLVQRLREEDENLPRQVNFLKSPPQVRQSFARLSRLLNRL